MKIEYDFKTTIVNIKIGECFLYKDELYMRIDWSEFVKTDDHFPNLAINLHTNKLDSFTSNAIVNKVKSKIVIGQYPVGE